MDFIEDSLIFEHYAFLLLLYISKTHLSVEDASENTVQSVQGSVQEVPELLIKIRKWEKIMSKTYYLIAQQVTLVDNNLIVHLKIIKAGHGGSYL